MRTSSRLWPASDCLLASSSALVTRSSSSRCRSSCQRVRVGGRKSVRERANEREGGLEGGRWRDGAHGKRKAVAPGKNLACADGAGPTRCAAGPTAAAWPPLPASRMLSRTKGCVKASRLAGVEWLVIHAPQAREQVVRMGGIGKGRTLEQHAQPLHGSFLP